MAWIISNSYLNQKQMENNAVEFFQAMHSNGWSTESCCGMLGNLQSESTINPGIWQDLKEGRTDLGFGLTQWTPATKLIDWATSLGLDYKSPITQMRRIDFEEENPGVQWIKTSRFPLTFSQFKASTDAPYYLAGAFLYNYERPKTPNWAQRGKQADAWYEYIMGIPPKPYTKGGMPLYMYNRLL